MVAASILSFKSCAIFLTRSTIAIDSSLTLSSYLLRACIERLWQNSVIILCERLGLPPRYIRREAIICTETNSLASDTLNLS